MQDTQTSTAQVTAYALWAVTALIFVVAGVLLAVGSWKCALFTASLGCGFSGFTAVMHIRWYSVRLCDLIRSIARENRHEPTGGGGPAVPLQRVH